MTEKDKTEWGETFEMLKSGEEIVQSDLEFGKVVSLKKELLDKMIQEINEARITLGDLEDGVELITLTGEGSEDS